ncbi:MAG TPA: SMP-30/gluconolactonase/LRE family protein [Mycobacteriales bacterium]|jgi:gluconolactonase|nr:SMP-30/gluconolactonase/LRE family protein [Mycobacteriales bacterium]
MAPDIRVTDLVSVGHGLDRPEHVMVTRDGRLLASDKSSAIGEVSPDGTLRRIGAAGGEPNGFAVTATGSHALVANFGHGLLQQVDLQSGAITVLARDEAAGHSIRWINFALVDSAGAIWASVCTQNDDLQDTIRSGRADGLIVRFDPDGSNPAVVAQDVNFPNCMALDRDEQHLYVVRTVAADVVRYPIGADRCTLGPQQAYGPPLGERRPDEFGAQAAALMADPAVTRRWGMADGCGFDAAGNLWVTLVFPNRVVAITPEGQAVTVLEDPDGALLKSPTSVAWGGPDLRDVYIGSLASPYVVKGRSSVPGMPMVHQRD